MVEGDYAVVTAVRDQCRRLHLRQKIGYVDIVAGIPDPYCILRRGRRSLQITEPLDLLGRSTGQIERAEGLHERRVAIAPTMSDERQIGGRLLPIDRGFPFVA